MKKFINKIFDYLQAVVNPTNGSAEAKLFIALVGFFYIMVSSFVDLFTGNRLKPSEFVFYTVVGLIVSCLGLTTYLNQKAMGIKGDIASEVVEKAASKQTTESAKEVMKSEKP